LDPKGIGGAADILGALPGGNTHEMNLLNYQIYIEKFEKS